MSTARSGLKLLLEREWQENPDQTSLEETSMSKIDFPLTGVIPEKAQIDGVLKSEDEILRTLEALKESGTSSYSDYLEPLEQLLSTRKLKAGIEATLKSRIMTLRKVIADEEKWQKVTADQLKSIRR
jgi:hypothetical protein